MTTSLPRRRSMSAIADTSGHPAGGAGAAEQSAASATSIPPAAGRGRHSGSWSAGSISTGAGDAYFSGDGIQAVVIEHNKPLTQKQYTELREQAKQLQERKLAATKGGRRAASQDPNGSPAIAEWTAEDEKLLAEIRKKLLANAPNRQANPAIAESVTLDVTIAPDARPGRHELRLMAAVRAVEPVGLLRRPVARIQREAGPGGCGSTECSGHVVMRGPSRRRPRCGSRCRPW